jgi:hypothetical protein
VFGAYSDEPKFSSNILFSIGPLTRYSNPEYPLLRDPFCGGSDD